MYAKIPNNFTRQDVDKIMANIFPGSNMNWSPISNVKIIAGKYKGARKSTAFIQPVGSFKITMLFLECPDGTKVLNWVTGFDQVLITLPIAFIVGLLTLFVSIKLFFMMIFVVIILAVCLILMKKGKNKTNDTILRSLDNLPT